MWAMTCGHGPSRKPTLRIGCSRNGRHAVPIHPVTAPESRIRSDILCIQSDIRTPGRASCTRHRDEVAAPANTRASSWIDNSAGPYNRALRAEGLAEEDTIDRRISTGDLWSE